MKHAKSLIFLLVLLVTCNALAQAPPPPEYTDTKYWIAHPEFQDMADALPGKKGQLTDGQKDAQVDVFFVYPTIYSGEQSAEYPWLADVTNDEMNKKVAESTIKNQASVFNGSAKVYAPLYRQAHIRAFYSKTKFKDSLLALAYEDVKKAFEHYMENWNNDRPIIIASHSQGTVHAARLLLEFFEGKDLMDQLVAAYIVGMPVQKDEFKMIPLCESADDTGCWMTWNTFRRDYYPPKYDEWYSNAASMNPLTWTLEDTHASWEENLGGVLRNFKRINAGVTDAQNHQGLLWINKPRFFGKILINWDSYHIADYNLFYMNIRENAATRIKAYFATRRNEPPASQNQD